MPTKTALRCENGVYTPAIKLVLFGMVFTCLPHTAQAQPGNGNSNGNSNGNGKDNNGIHDQ